MFNSKMVRLAIYLGILMSTTVLSFPSPISSVLQARKRATNSLDYSPESDDGEDVWKPKIDQKARENLHYSSQYSHPAVTANSKHESNEFDDVYHAPTPKTRGYEPNSEDYQQPREHLQSSGTFDSTASVGDTDESECEETQEESGSTHGSNKSTESIVAEPVEYESECDGNLGRKEQPQNFTDASNLSGPEGNKRESECGNYQDGNGQSQTCSGSSNPSALKQPHGLNESSSATSLDSNRNKYPAENPQSAKSNNEKNHIFMQKAINRTRETLQKLNSVLSAFGFRPSTTVEHTNYQPSTSDSTTESLAEQPSNGECSVRDSEIIEWEILVKAIVQRLEDVTIEFSEYLLYQQQ